MATVAIACQGGGSHTAFTGGALQRLVADENHRVVALSGTSGGAVCALLAWYGLLTGGAAQGRPLLGRVWGETPAAPLRGTAGDALAGGLARVGGGGGAAAGSPPAPPRVAAA